MIARTKTAAAAGSKSGKTLSEGFYFKKEDRDAATVSCGELSTRVGKRGRASKNGNTYLRYIL